MIISFFQNSNCIDISKWMGFCISAVFTANNLVTYISHELIVCFTFVSVFLFFLQYNWLQLDKTRNKWKINYKEITKKVTRKYSTSTYLTALSNRTVKKESGGGGRQWKKMNIYLKLKKETISKQWYWKSICSHYVFNRSL